MKVHSDQKKTFPKIKKEALLSIPLKHIKTKAEHDLKDRIASTTKDLVTFKNEHFAKYGGLKDRDAKDKAAHLEERINEAVFALYGLTSEEVLLIESIQMA